MFRSSGTLVLINMDVEVISSEAVIRKGGYLFQEDEKHSTGWKGFVEVV